MTTDTNDDESVPRGRLPSEAIDEVGLQVAVCSTVLSLCDVFAWVQLPSPLNLVLSRLDSCNSCRSYSWRLWMSVRTKIPSRDGHACHGG
jgi:hypothetical protein